MNTAKHHNIAEHLGELSPDGGRLATVLQVLPALVTGGVERGTIEITQAIAAAGGRALVASGGGPMVHEVIRAGGKHFVLPLNTRNPFLIWRNIYRLSRLIRQEKVDIVHARSRAPAWSARFAAARTGVHFVTTFHGTYSHGNPFKRYYNSVMVSGEKVIAISRYIASHIRRIYGVPSEKMRIIHRGVDLSRFDAARVSPERVIQLSNAWRLPDGAHVVMLPGRLTRWKGQTVFIEAAARIKRENVYFLLVGSAQGRHGYIRELEEIIRKRDLGAWVRIVNHCDDMPAAYMLTDVVVSASTDPEAFGRVVAEAQALGRPVVASNHGGATETVLEGETGWLVPPGDAVALAEAIEAALDLDPESRHRLAQLASERIQQEFSKDAMCAKTLDVYNEVLADELGTES